MDIHEVEHLQTRESKYAGDPRCPRLRPHLRGHCPWRVPPDASEEDVGIDYITASVLTKRMEKGHHHLPSRVIVHMTMITDNISIPRPLQMIVRKLREDRY